MEITIHMAHNSAIKTKKTHINRKCENHQRRKSRIIEASQFNFNLSIGGDSHLISRDIIKHLSSLLKLEIQSFQLL